MEPRSVEAAFARFCAAGDPAAMAEVFDRTAPELRVLARRLSRGGAEADDLIQETFLAAIEARDTFDAARPLVPWLVGILVRQASAARRRARRELDPARVVQREPDDARVDASAREFQALVVEALECLSPRDREVLVPLLFDGKRAVQIARELGRKPDTVRMRVHRGLERLRRLLPAGALLPAWLPWGTGLGEVRAHVLRAAARGAPGPVAAVPVAVPVAFPVAFTGGLWLAALLTGALLLAWRLAAPGAPGEPVASADSLEPRAAEANDADAQGPALAHAARRTDASGGAAEPATTKTTGTAELWLTGRIVGLRGDEAAAAGVVVRGLAARPLARAAGAAVAADGSFTLDVREFAALGARRLQLVVDHPRYLPTEARVDLAPGAAPDAGNIVLRPACAVTGTVHDAAGAPQAGAAVGLFSLRPGNQDVLPVDSATTTEDGQFRLRSSVDGRHALVAYRAGEAPAGKQLDLDAGIVDAGALRIGPGVTIAGRVRPESDHEAAGAGVSGAWVRLEAAPTPGERRLRLGDRRFLRRGDGFALATALARCDEEGRFEFAGLDALVFDLGVERLAGVQRPSVDPVASPSARGIHAPSFDVELGSPWAVLELDWGTAELDAVRRDAVAAFVACDGAPATRLVPGADGRARLQLAAGTRHDLALLGCSAGGARRLAVEAPERGAVRSLRLEVDAPSAPATLVLEWTAGRPATGESIGVGFFVAAGDGATGGAEGPALFERVAAVDAAGRASFADLPPGRWLARVRAGGTYSRAFGCALPVELELDLAPGATHSRAIAQALGGRARLVVHSSTGARQTARARLFDAAGTEHPLRLVALEPETSTEELGRFLVERWNEFGPLPAGRWRLSLEALWHEPLDLDFELRPGELVELAAEFRAR